MKPGGMFFNSKTFSTRWGSRMAYMCTVDQAEEENVSRLKEKIQQLVRTTSKDHRCHEEMPFMIG
jgi:hypothetical protein